MISKFRARTFESVKRAFSTKSTKQLVGTALDGISIRIDQLNQDLVPLAALVDIKQIGRSWELHPFDEAITENIRKGLLRNAGALGIRVSPYDTQSQTFRVSPSFPSHPVWTMETTRNLKLAGQSSSTTESLQIFAHDDAEDAEALYSSWDKRFQPKSRKQPKSSRNMTSKRPLPMKNVWNDEYSAQAMRHFEQLKEEARSTMKTMLRRVKRDAMREIGTFASWHQRDDSEHQPELCK